MTDELKNIILIVDDSPSARETLIDALEDEGYELHEATGGSEALSLASTLKPDIILLDVMMPDLDGFEVCRRLRATPALAEVPVLMITALDDRTSRINGIEAGADDFVGKPVDRIELRARIRTITRLNRYRKLREEHARLNREMEEREKLQAQFFQAQKMEAVGRLAGGVAHDFNNLLTIILGHTELAMMRETMSTTLYNRMQEVHMAAKLSANLTRQLLAFSSKQTITPKVLDLNSTVESMLKLVHRLIGEDIHVEWKPGKDLSKVRMDPSQIDQILANLCVNARDAIDGPGMITVQTGSATFDEIYCAQNTEAKPGKYVMMSVKDNGCGMDDETKEKIFEPFFTTKEQGKGTGLGLATVYGVIKQNNGFIEVESAPNKGTNIRVYLPEHRTSKMAIPERLSAPPTAKNSETILLVEDEAGVLRITERILKNLGYSVLTATAADEALGLIRSHTGRLDLMLTDVIMPQMNGRELAQHVMSLRHGLKYLYMSGYTANIISEHGILDEGIQFIHKPFSMKELAHKVREVLDAPV
jgi:two-component system cell cycle sensor histidine kinase/response regulator CckA